MENYFYPLLYDKCNYSSMLLAKRALISVYVSLLYIGKTK